MMRRMNSKANIRDIKEKGEGKEDWVPTTKYPFPMVPLVLHLHGIAPNFLKLDSLSPGVGFIPIISTKGIY